MGGDKKRIQFMVVKVYVRRHLEDEGVNKYNIKMDLGEVGCGGVDYIQLVQEM